MKDATQLDPIELPAEYDMLGPEDQLAERASAIRNRAKHSRATAEELISQARDLRQLADFDEQMADKFESAANVLRGWFGPK